MKKVILSTILVLLSMLLPAQVRQGYNYQADNLDGQGNPSINPVIQISDSITSPGAQPNTIKQQETQFRRNAIYFELGGQGILYSINYDCRITPHLSLRGGLSSWSFSGDFFLIQEKLRFTAFPLMVNYLTGPMKSSHLEIGIGLMPLFVSGSIGFLYTPSNDTGNRTFLVGTATFGYRYQPKDGGFVFRAGITPLIGGNGIAFTGGLSFGLGF